MPHPIIYHCERNVGFEPLLLIGNQMLYQLSYISHIMLEQVVRIELTLFLLGKQVHHHLCVTCKKYLLIFRYFKL